MATRDHIERGNFRPDGELSPENIRASKASSVSDGSGTLNGDVSPTATRGTDTLTSPATSDATLNSLIESSFFKNNSRFVEDNTSPRNLGVRTNDSEKTCSTPTEPARYRVIRNTSNPFPPVGGVGGGGGGIGGFRNSRTWVSPDTRYQHEFTIVRNAMRRLFKHSDVAKWRYTDYIGHREAIIASQKDKLSKTVSQKQQELELRIPQIDPKVFATLDALLHDHNFEMVGNTSRVLGEKTIWCVDWMNGKDEIAPWPTMPEMKWEGDDRAKTGVGRFPAIPREVGAPGIAWNQLQAVEVYPLDQVWRVPQMDDILLPVDEIVEDDKPDLINSELETAIDEYLES